MKAVKALNGVEFTDITFWDRLQNGNVLYAIHLSDEQIEKGYMDIIGAEADGMIVTGIEKVFTFPNEDRNKYGLKLRPVSNKPLTTKE